MDLKLIREEKSITQQQLADKIGKDRSLIAKIESGVTSPSVETAKAIANELSFDWTIFFAETGERYSRK